MLAIVGQTHAPEIFRRAAFMMGFELCKPEDANLIIVAEDTPTALDGGRITTGIKRLVYEALENKGATVVLTSQVEPGFTRRFLCDRLYHQSETLRIKDAIQRALRPEQQIIGCMDSEKPLPQNLTNYLLTFGAPIHKMTYEEAEFAKIAINVTLAHQVTLANALAERAASYGCNWDKIKTVLQHDKRIGKYAYLEPGDWKQSPHLLRDYVTFHEAR